MTGRTANEVHLKPPIATGIKGLIVSPFLKMRRQQVILPPHVYNTNGGYSKTLFSQALVKAFLSFPDLLIS